MTDDREDILAQRELAAVAALNMAWDQAHAAVLAYIQHGGADWREQTKAAASVAALQVRMRVLEGLGATVKDSAERRIRRGAPVT